MRRSIPPLPNTLLNICSQENGDERLTLYVPRARGRPATLALERQQDPELQLDIVSLSFSGRDDHFLHIHDVANSSQRLVAAARQVTGEIAPLSREQAIDWPDPRLTFWGQLLYHNLGQGVPEMPGIRGWAARLGRWAVGTR